MWLVEFEINAPHQKLRERILKGISWNESQIGSCHRMVKNLISLASEPILVTWGPQRAAISEEGNHGKHQFAWRRCITSVSPIGGEGGRKRLPRRLTPSLFVNNHRGKPYRRGLGNLLITMNRLGRYDQALALADQLENTCGDDAGAASLRAEIHLNRGAWEEAMRAARAVRGLWPEMSFVAAMASFELGRAEESIADFLHGACNHPGAVQLVAGRRTKAPRTSDEARDQRVGADLIQNLTGYMDRYGSQHGRFFGRVIANPRFGALMDEIEETRRRRDEERQTRSRVAWNLLLSMESPKFAAKRAADFRSPLRPGKTAESKAQTR